MITLTKPVFEKLIGHMLYIEESAEALAEFYFPDSPEDREDLKKFYEYYIKAIEAEIEKVITVSPFEKVPCPEELNRFPFVIIGSEVTLETAAGKNPHIYRVITPDSERVDKHSVTYLSALGRALLLRKKGSKININDSHGKESLRISNIKLLLS